MPNASLRPSLGDAASAAAAAAVASGSIGTLPASAASEAAAVAYGPAGANVCGPFAHQHPVFELALMLSFISERVSFLVLCTADCCIALWYA